MSHDVLFNWLYDYGLCVDRKYFGVHANQCCISVENQASPHWHPGEREVAVWFSAKVI